MIKGKEKKRNFK